MKRIGIGYENYKDFIDQDLYYVDKTLLVRDVLRMGGKATLLTRPRRFEKHLNRSKHSAMRKALSLTATSGLCPTAYASAKRAVL